MSQANAELACNPSFSGENSLFVPSRNPETRTYVTKDMHGMYRSGELRSSRGAMASFGVYLTLQSWRKHSGQDQKGGMESR